MPTRFEKPDFGYGDVLTLAKMNQIVRAVVAQLTGAGNTAVRFYSDRTVIDSDALGPRRPDVSNYIMEFVVLEELEDLLKCAFFYQPTDDDKTDWRAATYDDTLGDDDPVVIYVAKPYNLQRTFWQDRVIDIGGVDYTYNISSGVRTATPVSSGDPIVENLTPNYAKGELIYAIRGVTGFTGPDNVPVGWMDLNNAGRKWEAEPEAVAGDSLKPTRYYLRSSTADDGFSSTADVYHHAGMPAYLGVGTTITNATAFENRLYFYPFMTPRGDKILKVGLIPVTATGGTTGRCRVGVYSNNSDRDCYPVSLLSDFGEIAFNGSTGRQSLTLGTPYVLSPGVLYWIAFVFNNAARTNHTFSAFLPGAMSGVLGVSLGPSAAAGNIFHYGFVMPHTYGALPSTASGMGTWRSNSSGNDPANPFVLGINFDSTYTPG